METIGIVNQSQIQLIVTDKGIEIFYFNKRVEIHRESTASIGGLYLLTEVGNQLAHIIKSNENKKFFEDVLAYIKNYNFRIAYKSHIIYII